MWVNAAGASQSSNKDLLNVLSSGGLPSIQAIKAFSGSHCEISSAQNQVVKKVLVFNSKT
jgi:hypothetical protein